MDKQGHIGETLIMGNNQAKTIPSQLTEAEIAYLAGLFDGEGYVSIREQTRRSSALRAERNGFGGCHYGLCVGISMCDEKVIKWIYDTFGGSKVIAGHTKGHERWNLAWHWRAYGENALAILRHLYPYLRVKKEKAALAFKFQQLKRQTFRRKDAHRLQLEHELYLEMRAMNKRGKGARRSDGVETERLAPSDGMKFQSELGGDVENATLVTT